MRKSYILSAVVCLWAATAHATVVKYMDDNALFKQADIVMVANVWRYDVRPGAIFEFTDYELEASECFKGCQPGQFVMMSSPGVSPTRPTVGLHETIAGAPHPEQGERVIVYLQRQPDGDYQLLSLGLSFYRVSYNSVMHRYIAHRQVDSLVALQPPRIGVARDADTEVRVPATAFASDVIEQLRQRAKDR